MAASSVDARLKAARALLAKWRKILGLGEQWMIELYELVGGDDPAGESGVFGQAYLEGAPYRRAKIFIGGHLLRGPAKRWADHAETTVVHELLHVRMTAYDAISAAWAGEDLGRQQLVRHLNEQLVTDLERAFMRAAGKKVVLLD